MQSSTKGVLSLMIATLSYGLYGVYFRMISLGFGVFSQGMYRNIFVLVLAGIAA